MSFLLHISIISTITLYKLNVFLFWKKGNKYVFIYKCNETIFKKRTFLSEISIFYVHSIWAINTVWVFTSKHLLELNARTHRTTFSVSVALRRNISLHIHTLSLPLSLSLSLTTHYSLVFIHYFFLQSLFTTTLLQLVIQNRDLNLTYI
jgi:hypothetical protein